MLEEIPILKSLRSGENLGIEIAEFSSPEVDLICPYFHQRFIAEDGSWFVCEGRFNGSSDLVRVDVREARAWRLTRDGAVASVGDLGPRGTVFYFARGDRILGVDALSGEERGNWATPAPSGLKMSRLFHVNSEGRFIALSGNKEHASGQQVGQIWALRLSDGVLDSVIERPFQIGHVQFSTQDPDLLMYCHETGGASPQRMWLARTQGKAPGALFDDPGHPWVTHESFCGDGQWISFVRHPEGMGLIRKDNAEVVQIDAEGAWHCAANHDASALVFDTHAGEIRLWERAQGRICIVAGSEPYQAGNHAHPRFLPGDRSVIWTSTRGGRPHAAIARLFMQA